ncbi:hypothetical protein M885DRAFT_494996 [Pelagophyceae sp. CCMP2097]|nr:hypothetical protein M885DRAFT_494996 [Pelagophyceae sp. CCMP2097]
MGLSAAVCSVALCAGLCASASAEYSACPSVGRAITRDYSKMDAVVVSIGMMCGTSESIKRLLYFYNLRRVYYILPDAQAECAAIEAIDPRVTCLGEGAVLEGNASVATLSAACRASWGEWSTPSKALPAGTKAFGWYLQQFIKLGVARTLPQLSEDYLVWDGDNVLLGGNHELMEGGKAVFAENGNGRCGPVCLPCN